MPVNTSYLNVGGAPIALPSQFTVALGSQVVQGSTASDSNFSIPARLLPLNARAPVNTGAPIMLATDSAISTQLVPSVFYAGANTFTIRLSNVSTAAVTQRAGTWGIAFFQGLP